MSNRDTWGTSPDAKGGSSALSLNDILGTVAMVAVFTMITVYFSGVIYDED